MKELEVGDLLSAKRTVHHMMTSGQIRAYDVGHIASVVDVERKRIRIDGDSTVTTVSLLSATTCDVVQISFLHQADLLMSWDHVGKT